MNAQDIRIKVAEEVAAKIENEIIQLVWRQIFSKISNRVDYQVWDEMDGAVNRICNQVMVRVREYVRRNLKERNENK